MAKSGTAAAHLLLDSGIQVRINDLKANKTDAEVQALLSKGAEVITGSHPLEVLDDVDLMVKNPGIPYNNPLVEEAGNRDIPVITEVELAGRIHEGPLVAVTGSNGKTTTTTLIHKMIKADRKPVAVAGNIGKVACEVARTTGHDETMVIELSSFQLLGTQTFKPDISVWLNLYEAHLDYHGTLENYHQAKAKIAKFQTEEDFLVYNTDDKEIRKFLPEVKAELVPCSITERTEGAWVDEKWVYFKDEPIIKREDIVLVGEHNLANIIAAVAAVKLNGVTNEAIFEVLTTFSGVEHRLQFIEKKQGRYIYNDSKATNILATSYALRSFQKPVILLAGGLDRGNSFDTLIPFLTHVKTMVLFGETANLLEAAGKEAGVNDIVKVSSMDEAVEKAFELSLPDEVILLSPACASWDQYRTFEERGNMFIEAVHKLK
ncbi:UDP-N-acetylmuramoyl-L-alanine--D-glutamate ligase [Halobacillus salinarum]|uniref:UDP-N-acetylmuramoylalanine--D-glutamate ligase n=2 Tax=Halobacillus salinarum TaxID=2932257 RepID=A0ABY4ER81_9BACI|nr:UDP-N-acetylmuramoyl-L-alanine--D-glutamate ligase [Halobacillus salinarum]